ncbi:glycosyltransferase family 4 protein [bacterium]|nr:glycosyltransferase family 4 protein [bacterium]
MLEALHLFANHKITGPAELALETARAVARTGRVRARFFSSDVRPGKHRDRWLQLLARERGVEEPLELGRVRLSKHLSLSAWGDVRELSRFLSSHPPDVIHAHLPNDHLLAAWASARAKKPIPIVRTLYDGEPPRASWRARRTLGTAAAIVCLSRTVAQALVESASSYGLDAKRVRALDPPIDTERFDPERPRGEATREKMRAALGIPADAFCLGIVARMQPHRRFEVLLEATKLARARVPSLRLLIVGRGTKQDAVAREPVKKLGLDGAVIFPGHVAGEDYVALLASMDAKVFLVPGSDGSCRAVREALSMGVPVIAARRGILPELVREGTTGLVVQDEAGPLSEAIVSLAGNDARRRELSAAARRDAVDRFSLARFAENMIGIYETVSRP